jgi:hypothetical protein
MYYNLDNSFPAPVTYFDIKSYLPDLLSRPVVNFEDKLNNSNLVWILSNCNAFNGRQKYIAKLMKLGVKIDSYGKCLRNAFNQLTKKRLENNIEMYSKYKFVFAIENSNCKDYVTEKLVHVIASGSIPIVAGRDDKPNYLKFLPNNSFINIYDFKSINEFIFKIESIASNRTEYEQYMKFKFKHNYTSDYLRKLPIDQIIRIAKEIIDPNELFFKELIEKETSTSKECKIAKYLKETPENVIRKEINLRKTKREHVKTACLPKLNIFYDFLLE